jgi:hypothetical protein
MHIVPCSMTRIFFNEERNCKNKTYHTLNEAKEYPIAPQEPKAIDFIRKKIAQLSQDSGREEIEIFEIINSEIINIIIYMKWIE